MVNEIVGSRPTAAPARGRARVPRKECFNGLATGVSGERAAVRCGHPASGPMGGSGTDRGHQDDIAAKIKKYITERGGTVKVRDVQTRFFKQDTVELARAWLAKQYVDSGRARFERIGKSLRLVMLEPEEPVVEYGEDDDLTPIDRMESREAGRLENATAPGMRRNTFPAMEPYEVEPGVFDFGDCVVDIRELARNFEK